MKSLSAFVRLLVAGSIGATAALPTQLRAAAYASGLTNNSGSISFILNEAASNVKIISNSGATTNDLGTLPKGLYTSANLGITGSYQVVVSSSLPSGYTQTSVDANVLVKFNSPRGVTINNHPSSPYFGRIYVANSAAGTTGGRSVGDGIYMLNADQSDAIGKSNTVSTAGINFTSSSSDPWKISVGDDDYLYINNFASADCTVWAVDQNVSGSYVTNVLQGLGLTAGAGIHADAASTPIVRGSLSSNNLVLINVDGSASGHFNQIARWDIGSGPLAWAGAPTYLAYTDRTPVNLGVAGLTTDVDYSPTLNYYYTSIFRSGNDTASLKVMGSDGVTLLWDSLSASVATGTTTNDMFQNTRAIAFNADYSTMFVLNDNNNVAVLKLTNGIPDLSSKFIITNTPATSAGRDIAVDIAGNVYTASSGQGLLRVLSVGGLHVATTGSDGTFNIINPIPNVSVVASDSLAAESGPDTGTFTISRTGDTSQPLVVNYAMSGSASNGVDYASLSGTVTIPAGLSSLDVVLTPIDDSVSEFQESATLTLVSNANYSVDIPNSATVTILDNDTPELSLSAAQPTAYENTPGDYVTFQISRKGDTNLDVIANITYSGTATDGVNYHSVASVEVPSGVINQNFSVSIMDDSVLEATNLTIVATIAPDASYNVATNATATATIIDDELPAETVLFADNFTSDTSTNWNVLFGSNNGVDDKLVGFMTSLSGDLVNTAPNGSDNALKLTVNKFDSTAAGSAGVNLYPIGQTFSGDYAMRFDMMLQQNTGAGTTEFALFGINLSGTKTNWVRESAVGPNNPQGLPLDCDGLWFSVIADASASAPGDFCLISGTNNSVPLLLASRTAASMANVYKKPPFTPGSGAGVPTSIDGAATKIWVNVEVKSVSNIVTMSINKTPVITYTNTTAYTNGNIMLGYMDPYDSIGSASGAVYYSNLRVVSLSTGVQQPVVSSVQSVSGGSQLQIDFTGSPTDQPSSFTVVGASALPSVSSGFTPEPESSIISTGAGKFRATVPVGSGTHFFRIKR